MGKKVESMKKKILIVDDEQELSMILSELLTMNGYDVVTASSAKQALSYFAECRFDLILLDVMMPVMNGLQFLKAARSHSNFTGTPVVMISATNIVENMADYGWSEIAVKPFTFDQILNIAKKYTQ